MKAVSWFCISFGGTLGLVVGLRLNLAGLIVVATALLGALLLCPLLALHRGTREQKDTAEVEVRVEVPQRAACTPRPLGLPATRKARRGGWQYLNRDWFASEEPGSAVT